MICKQNVIVNTLAKEMVWALWIADILHEIYTAQEITVTSCNDGKHQPGSLHYVGLALDFRIWALTNADKVDQFVAALKTSLGPAYDVILEATHIHVEYDPKKQ